MKTPTTLAMLGVAALLSACAGMSQSGQEMSMAADDGARIWRTTCGRCHNARPAAEFNAEQWPVIVSHMRTHADLTRSEADAVAAFLSAAAEAAPTSARP